MSEARRVTTIGVFVLVAMLFGQATVGYSTASPSESERSLNRARYGQNDGTVVDDLIVITSQPEAREANPSGEQTLRLAGPVQGLDSLDPALSRDLGSAFLIRQVFRGLTRFDDDLQPVPELAERIEISSDGLVYTFHLRQGARFHDGSPIEALDVVASLTRALAPATAGGRVTLLGGPTFLSDIDGAADVISGETSDLHGVEAIDERTVRIRLEAPRATFLMKLASAPASIVDGEQASSDPEWWRTPNGSGPFSVDDWVPDNRLTLSAFDDFFAGKAPLTTIEMLLGTNALQSFNLYQAGEIDVDSIGINVLDRVLAPESGMRDEVTVTPLFAVNYIAFRSDIEPMDDPMIRRAVQLGFPRVKVSDVTYDGYVAPAHGLIPNGMLGRDWPANMLEYDLQAARDAVSQSRYESPENVPPIRIYAAGGGESEALRDVLHDDLGLTVEVISIEWSEFMDGLARQQYSAYELYWGADFPDPESLLWTLFGTGRADNYVAYSNSTFDDLLRQAAKERDVDRRAELNAQAQQVLMDDLLIIPLYFDVSYTVSKLYVRGLQITPLGILRLETVWMER